MRIDSPDRKTHILLKDDGTELTRLIRQNWMSRKAELLTDGRIYQLETAVFSSKLTLTYQGTPVLEITFPWRGGARLQDLTGTGRSFVVKQESVWNSRYSLGDEGRAFARFRFGFDWKKFRERVDLEAGDVVLEVCPPWILLSAVYAIIVKRSRQAAAASA